MKIAGWIFLVIGVLSFIGAASKGHSVFGPCFWVALGGYLLYRASKKEDEEEVFVTSEDVSDEDSSGAGNKSIHEGGY